MLSNEAIMIREYLRNSGMWNKSLGEIRRSIGETDVVAELPTGIKNKMIDAKGVKCEIFTPEGADSRKLVVYFHGGGYCVGIVNTNRAFVAKLAKESGYCTLLIDYRLAPENPYPAAHEDVLSVCKWLMDSGYNSENIVFIGDSSGCGLILATLFKLREFSINMPAAIALMTPVVDYTKTGESLTTRKEVDPFQYEDPFNIANNFLGDNPAENPYISPLLGNLCGLPPMLIQAADYDVFLSDSTELSKIAEEAGCKVYLTIWEGLWHIFQMSANMLPEGQIALNDIYEFIKVYLK